MEISRKKGFEEEGSATQILEHRFSVPGVFALPRVTLGR